MYIYIYLWDALSGVSKRWMLEVSTVLWGRCPQRSWMLQAKATSCEGGAFSGVNNCDEGCKFATSCEGNAFWAAWTSDECCKFGTWPILSTSLAQVEKLLRFQCFGADVFLAIPLRGTEREVCNVLTLKGLKGNAIFWVRDFCFAAGYFVWWLVQLLWHC